MRRSFEAETGLVEDVDGVTVGMRGYYGFNYRRYRHAISPYTPAVLLELGFVSNPIDRKLLTSRPEYWAGLILRGLQDHFEHRIRSEVEELRPMDLPRYVRVLDGAVVRTHPRVDAGSIVTLDSGAILRPVDKSGEWFEVFIRRLWKTGWIAKADLISEYQL
jgi:N-acetylmuramoyl-L-alanine amidase